MALRREVRYYLKRGTLHQEAPVERSQLLRGVLDVAVLAVIAERDGYGYDIQRRLVDSGIDGVGEATIYGTLRRLYRAGSLSSYSRPSDEGPHRRYYGLTDAGRTELGTGRTDWREFVDAVDRLLMPTTQTQEIQA